MNDEKPDLKSGEEWIEGQILIFDKPFGWTSFQLVKKVRVLVERRHQIRKLKVGHAGTLDPLATGLMVIATGKATRKLEALQLEDKEYLATVRLGATTPSFDLETPVDHLYPFQHITEEAVLDLFTKMTGEQDQVPPLFSAKKIDGVRAYTYARKGREKTLEANRIRITRIELVRFDLPEIAFIVGCSKGTYIRALARDLGTRLGSGGHLTALRRTASGNFTVETAYTVESFEKYFRAT